MTVPGPVRRDACPSCGAVPPESATECPACGQSLRTGRPGLPVPLPPREALVRDLVAFEIKLGLDWLKDVILAPLAVVAFVADLLRRPTEDRSMFYRVLRLGRRFELWLDLYSPSGRASVGEGLIDSSAISADSLLRGIERAIRDGRIPERDLKRLRRWSAKGPETDGEGTGGPG